MSKACFAFLFREDEVMINLSKYLGLGGRLEEEGVFDVVLNKDAPYFINIKRLSQNGKAFFALFA